MLTRLGGQPGSRLARIAILACLVLAGFSGVTAASAIAAPTCEIADVLRANELFDDATTAYAKLLDADPALQCARDGLTRVARERASYLLDLALKLRELGFDTAAADKVQAALASDPSATIPSGLSDIARKAGTDAATKAFDAVVALQSAGFRSEAREALRKAIAEYPKTPIPDTLAELQVAPPQWALRAIDVGATTGQVVLGVVAILLAVSFLAYVIWAWLSIGLLSIEEFAPTDATAKALVAQIGQLLRKISDDNGGLSIRVADPSAGIQLPELGDVVPSFRGLTGIVTFLLSLSPRQRYVLSGSLHSAGDRGAGMTLRIRCRRFVFATITDEITIWQADFERWKRPAAPSGSRPATSSASAADVEQCVYQRLATIAAVWTAYAVIKDGDADGNKQPRGLVTQNWRSYAYFASGVDWRDRFDPRRSRLQFRRAIELDGGNWLATYALGQLDWHEADPQSSAYGLSMRRALQRFDKARADRTGWRVT